MNDGFGEMNAGNDVCASAGAVSKQDQFVLLADLGIVTVPDDYDPLRCLAMFEEKHQKGANKTFCRYESDFNDGNFRNPSRVLRAGDKFHVRVFEQIEGVETTAAERLAFSIAQGCVFPCAQGLPLVYEQKHDQLPKGRSYTFLDAYDRLLFFSVFPGYRRMPLLFTYADSQFGIFLDYFEFSVTGKDPAFLTFNECE